MRATRIAVLDHGKSESRKLENLYACLYYCLTGASTPNDFLFFSIAMLIDNRTTDIF